MIAENKRATIGIIRGKLRRKPDRIVSQRLNNGQAFTERELGGGGMVLRGAIKAFVKTEDPLRQAVHPWKASSRGPDRPKETKALGSFCEGGVSASLERGKKKENRIH